MLTARVIATAIVAASLLLSAPVSAGYLVQEAHISRVTSIADNQSKFAVLVTGGVGPCASLWIEFPPSAAPDADAHKRAYAALLMAFASGMRITVFNYANDACTGGSYVEIYH
jgi:hypothetical protein